MRTAGLLLLAILILPISAHAALVNINTADAALLDTLPGIGASYAADIIAYREAHGPFATIEGLKKVPNIGSGSRYANIAPLITVGDTSVVNNSNTSDTSNTTSSTQNTTASSEDMTTYTPPPSALTVDAGINRDAVMEVPLHLSARALTKSSIDPHAHIAWGFGDGSSAEGSVVEKTYHYAGSYLVVVTATDGEAAARDEFIVTVRPAQVRILEIPDAGIMVMNDTNERLDLSGWALFADRGSFRIPNGTVMLPKASILLPTTITKLPTAPEVTLAYPSGGIAARYAVSTEPIAITTSASALDAQPPSRIASYEQVQKVEPIISVTENVPEYAEAVGAPAVANELAAAGAVLPPPTLSVGAPTSDVGAAPIVKGIFKSPWALGFLGVVVLAGSVFIFL
ncbi:MAG: helix-hairpin-helix domain-containing protein [Candidatus Parcubacteria bacterium]|nr:helix-hairpin-helix domain-containing protein [Candidatus Parcubacteria bacterium]